LKTEAIGDIGWHTITYLDAGEVISDKTGSKTFCITCGTSHGYVFFWKFSDSLQNVSTFGSKMHAGSIEGMTLNQKLSLISTCSSDCTVQIFSFASML